MERLWRGRKWNTGRGRIGGGEGGVEESIQRRGVVEGCQGREERTFRTWTAGTSCRRLAEGHDKSSKYKGGGEVKLVTTNIVAGEAV